MSDGNIEVVRGMYEAFGAGDIAGIIARQAEDTVWDHSGPPGNPLNRVFEGHAGVGEFFEILGGTQETLEFEPKEFFASGDRVVAVGFFRFRVTATGKEWESDWAMTYTLRDGLITHWRPIFDMSAEAAAYQP